MIQLNSDQEYFINHCLIYQNSLFLDFGPFSPYHENVYTKTKQKLDKIIIVLTNRITKINYTDFPNIIWLLCPHKTSTNLFNFFVLFINFSSNKIIGYMNLIYVWNETRGSDKMKKHKLASNKILYNWVKAYVMGSKPLKIIFNSCNYCILQFKGFQCAVAMKMHSYAIRRFAAVSLTLTYF